MIEPLLQAERLLTHGQIDSAERAFNQIVAADPRNAIAVVGLARIALERGDEKLAYERVCSALEIDRQDIAALRLEARLSEVLTTRGEKVTRPPWLVTPDDERPGLLRRILGR
jgi:thioredoxin-like negative regulator of GroEL